MKKKIDKLKRQVRYLPETIALIWQSSGWLMVVWALLLVLLGVLPALQIYLVKPLIDGLTQLSGSIDTLENVKVPIAVLGATLLLMPAMNSLLVWVRTVQAEKVQNSIREQIQQKAIALKMEHFEDALYYDKLHRARIDAINKPVALLENVGAFAQNMLTLLAILFILLPVGVVLPFFLVLSSIPTLYIALKFTLRFHEWRMKNTKNERKLSYLEHVITHNESAAELRTFALGEYFKSRYWTLKHTVQTGFFSMLNAQLKAELFSAVIAFLMMTVAIIWMVEQTMDGMMSAGMLVMYYFAFTQGQKIVKSLFSTLSELYKNLMFLENLFSFLSIDEMPVGTQTPLKLHENYTVEIEGLSFKYPKSDLYALQNITLTLRPDHIVAIVGTNGSGKSTLVKLLNRFYDPTEGQIRINGTTIEAIEPKSLRKEITVLFQNFIQYHLSVAENIGLGSVKKGDDHTSIKAAAAEAGVAEAIERLPQGYETILGRWFGGAELSGGEWQKIALARAFFKDSNIVILDEPTSAFDSWAEAQWLDRFKYLCRGKTAMIITHRFTTARHADMIYVMDRGCVVESGSHDELLKLNGLYATSWSRQITECH